MGRAARRRARRPDPPLTQRDGLDPVRWRVGPGALERSEGTIADADAELSRTTALDALLVRFPPLADAGATPLARRFERGDVVRADGTAWAATERVAEGDEFWFHRELRSEEILGEDPPILLQDEHLIVLDKPHGMATMPRGAHVLASALVRLRRATGIASLTPLHRLDRRTAGVLALGIRPEERAAYQGLFARGEVHKEYLARIMLTPGSPLPQQVGERCTLRDRLVKTHGELQTRIVPGEPNALTDLEVLEVDDGEGPGEAPETALGASAGAGPQRTAVVRLHPRTGRTHQLRAQLSARGAPILGDDLYPAVRRLGPEDAPLALIARRLAFPDPITGALRDLTSGRELP